MLRPLTAGTGAAGSRAGQSGKGSGRCTAMQGFCIVPAAGPGRCIGRHVVLHNERLLLGRMHGQSAACLALQA